MSHRVRAVINLSALRHNLGIVRRHAPRSRIMAAVKANGYGHGALQVAQALRDADAFAVACLDEALRLQQGGIRQPIVLLGGVLDADELYAAAERGLQVVLHDFRQLTLAESAGCRAGLQIWIKLDTGMHRLGFAPEAVPELQRRLQACPDLRITGWMTHLACADERAHPATGMQLRRFAEALTGVPGPRSIANSAAILSRPDSHADWVRPGIMLYGGSPYADASAESLGLRPVMTLHSRILGVRELAAGDAVGYGGSWTAPERMRVGVIAAGYGDGYPRHAPSGTPVLVGGRPAPLVGRVSMDLITVDLRGHPEAHAGDEVVLWGEGLPADAVALQAGTISYELFTRVTRRAVFEYVED